MSIYAKEKSLSQNLLRLFDFDQTVNIYEVMKLFLLQHNEIILNKLPEFYRIFLKDPSRFKEFLDIIYESCLLSEQNIYQDINVLTLMCFAVFHITKLYIMLNRVHTDYEQVIQDAANYYHLPLGKWIYNIIIYSEFEYKVTFVIQHSNSKFLNTFQYLLLMSFVSKELYIKDRPLFKYMEAIQKLFYNKEITQGEVYPVLFDPIDDILKILILDEIVYNRDIYSFHFKLQYVLSNNRIESSCTEIIHYRYFVEKYREMNFDNIFINNTYNITKYTKRVPDIKNIFYKLYQNDLSWYKIPIFMIFETIFDVSETYNVISSATRHYEIEIDKKWLYFVNKLYNFLMNSEDLETDFTYTLYSLGGYIGYSHLFTNDDVFKRDETLLFAIVRNIHFEKNSAFIHKLLKGIMSRDFSIFPKYMMRKLKSMAEFSYNDTLLLYKRNEHNIDILLLLLERLFKKDMLAKSIHVASSILHNNNRTFKTGSFDNDQLKFVFKDIIQELLANCKNLKNDEYLSMLYQYEDSLREINVDLSHYNSKYMSFLSHKMICCICICKGWDD